MTVSSGDGWPFGNDALRDDPLTALRIAVTTSHPAWFYIVAFDVESEARPTDAEAEMLASYLESYCARNYGPPGTGYRVRMERYALDVDGGANGVVFHKYGENDWGYRRRSWYGGQRFVPIHPNVRAQYGDTAIERGTFTLEQIMDRAHDVGKPDGSPAESWLEWKAAHPDAFPTEASV
jgi:hypothetical protein